jgi:hypothetical protein
MTASPSAVISSTTFCARLEPVEPAQVVGDEVQRIDLGLGEGARLGDLLRAAAASA